MRKSAANSIKTRIVIPLKTRVTSWRRASSSVVKSDSRKRTKSWSKRECGRSQRCRKPRRRNSRKLKERSVWKISLDKEKSNARRRRLRGQKSWSRGEKRGSVARRKTCWFLYLRWRVNSCPLPTIRLHQSSAREVDLARFYPSWRSTQKTNLDLKQARSKISPSQFSLQLLSQ